MADQQPDINQIKKDVDTLYTAFHLLMWDYHARNHAELGDTTDYLSCIHYPCINFALNVFKR